MLDGTNFILYSFNHTRPVLLNDLVSTIEICFAYEFLFTYEFLILTFNIYMIYIHLTFLHTCLLDQCLRMACDETKLIKYFLIE